MYGGFVVLSGRLNALKKPQSGHISSVCHLSSTDLLTFCASCCPKGTTDARRCFITYWGSFCIPAVCTQPQDQQSVSWQWQQAALAGGQQLWGQHSLVLQRTNSCLSPPQSGAKASSHRFMVMQKELCPANTITSCSPLGASGSPKSGKIHQETPLTLLWEIIEHQLL